MFLAYAFFLNKFAMLNASPPQMTTIPIVFWRLKLNFSDTAAKHTSASEMSDVIPATVKDKKNNTPNNDDIGNSFIICGNTTNASPTTGTPMLFAINPRAAKTPIPANNSN